MNRYILAGLLSSILAAVILFTVDFPHGGRLERKSTAEDLHHSSRNHKRNDGSDRSFDPSSDLYLKPVNLVILLDHSDAEITQILDGLDQVQVSSVLNALGRMASTDINSRGDYSLAHRLVGVLNHSDAGRILEWVFRSKSPLGWELDFREQRKVVEAFSNGKPSSFLEGNFLRSFGMLQGADVANSGTLPPLNKYEYLSYLDGVCQSSREAVFGNVLLILDKAIHESAVERAVPALMAQDAEGFSVFLGNMPSSDTKDLTVLQMIKWLAKNNAHAECPPWVLTISSPAVKARAEQVIAAGAASE